MATPNVGAHSVYLPQMCAFTNKYRKDVYDDKAGRKNENRLHTQTQNVDEKNFIFLQPPAHG